MIGKWILKTWIIINNFGQLHTQELKSTKKQVLRLQLNEKTWKESQTWLMSLYWKRKPIWRKDLITYNSFPWIMFSFKQLVIIWRGGGGGGGGGWGEGSFEIGRPRWRGWKNFGHRWTKWWGVLKIRQFSWTSYVYHPLCKLIFELLRI